METVHGTYRDGHIELDGAVGWPEGWRVTVIADREQMGMNEADWPKTPEALAAFVARMESREPPEMTEQEWEEWQAARQTVKEYTLAHMDRDIPSFDP